MWFLADTSIPSWLLEGDILDQVMKIVIFIAFYFIMKMWGKNEKRKRLIQTLQGAAMKVYRGMYTKFKSVATDHKITTDERRQLLDELKEIALETADEDIKPMITEMAPAIFESTAEMVVGGLKKLGGGK